MPRDPIETPALPAAPDALLAAHLVELAVSTNRDIIMVARSENRAGRLAKAAAALAPSLEVLVLPAWDSLPFDRAPPSRLVMGQRMAAARRAAREDRATVLLVGSIDAVAQRLPQAAAWRSVDLQAGGAIDLDAFGVELERLGYTVGDGVDEPGEATVRTNVIDVFPPAHPHPVRIDVADGRVTDIRAFDAVTQRSLGETIAALTLGPASEILDGNTRHESGAEDEGAPGQIIELRLACLHPGLTSIFDIMPAAAIVLDDEADVLFDQRTADIRDAFRALDSLPSTETGADPSPWSVHLDREAWDGIRSAREIIRVGTGAPAGEAALPRFARTSDFASFVRERQVRGARIGITGPERHRRALLRALGAADAPRIDGWSDLRASPPRTIARLAGTLGSGFATTDAVVVAPADVLGARARPQAGNTATPFDMTLAPGNAVIHFEHGVGILNRIETVDAGGVATDCLHLEYAGGTGLLVPAEEIDRIWRYGAEAEGITLDRLKGDAWPKRRADILTDMRQTAERLAALARERERAQGPALEPDRARYGRLVARFPFVPTLDQEDAFSAIEADLASGRPMDRLVCGDVGFGKTEVAIRAAALAAFAGWQVAIVVPTTVLARQHIETFARRFAGLDVRIAGLSRLTPATEARAVRAGLADGSIGVVIGTQAIAARTVRFRKLGLVIVDEEQRFGVRQKSALRALGQGVHALTLTATPIPRTLQTALAGLQELSVLATGPARRQPIRTVRMEFSAAQVARALRRERRRGGQSFVVCPRVGDLAPMRARLQEAARELRIVEAHGEMKADALDEAMLRFARGDADVLLATNIIEAGLDLPRANTMLIWHPDQFGLAQMHQLRGRVGRGRVRGALYLMTEPGAKLPASARKRMEALESMNRLGSGFAISARDLDLRGAGDLLGEEQAGHVKLLGLDLYRYLLGRALRMARGEPDEEEWTPEISLGLTACLPSSYISDESARVALHDRLGRLLRARDRSGLDEISDELEDRFGPLPQPVENLLALASIRLRCRDCGIARLGAGPAAVAITPRPGVTIDVPGGEQKGERLVFAQPGGEDAGRLAAVASVLDAIC